MSSVGTVSFLLGRDTGLHHPHAGEGTWRTAHWPLKCWTQSDTRHFCHILLARAVADPEGGWGMQFCPRPWKPWTRNVWCTELMTAERRSGHPGAQGKDRSGGGWVMSRRVKPFFHPFHHLFHLRKGNPQTSSTVAGGHTLGSQWKEAARNTNISYPPSGLVPGKFWKEWG